MTLKRNWQEPKSNFTAIPNIILDRIMPRLSATEWKVYSYLARRTFGFHVKQVHITVEQIVYGITKPDGTELDGGAGVSARSTASALKALEGHGLISRESGTGRTPNLIRVEQNERSLAEKCKRSTAMVAVQSRAPCTADSAVQGNRSTAGDAVQGQPHHIIEKESREKESTPPTPSSEKKETEGTVLKGRVGSRGLDTTPPPTPSPPQAVDESVLPSLVRFDPEDDVVTFTRNLYRRSNRRAKLENLKARAQEPLINKLVAKEEEWGMRDFRCALLCYLEDQSDYLAEKRWPLRLFLSQVESYVGTVPEQYQDQAETGAPEALTPSDAVTHAGDEAKAPEGLKSQLPDLWNELVPECPVEWNPTNEGGIRVRTLANDRLQRDFREICKKASAIHKARGDDTGWLTFYWLLGNKDGTPNWRRLLNGELDWMAKAPTKRASAVNVMDKAAEMMIQELRNGTN